VLHLLQLLTPSTMLLGSKDLTTKPEKVFWALKEKREKIE